jgi:hypothetical protein
MNSQLEAEVKLSSHVGPGGPVEASPEGHASGDPHKYTIHDVPELHECHEFLRDRSWIVVVYHFSTRLGGTIKVDRRAMDFGVEAYGTWIQQPTFIDPDAMAGLS